MTLNSSQNSSNPELNKDIKKRFFQIALVWLITSLILFVSAGTLNWLWAWIFIAIYPIYTFINSRILPKELIAERSKVKNGQKKWDKTITKLIILPSVITPIIAGLDIRFNWTGELNLYIHFAGLFFYILGNVIVTWAMASNKFFSTVVRIQTDREHRVASSGPYKYVRHPGYVGIILNLMSSPLIFGSLWSLIPSFFGAFLFVLRTALEDKTLKMELDGYKEFSGNVRFRLIPGIW
jgi:protein-S-isoprenylcysteine O-methyltransferase Ste14